MSSPTLEPKVILEEVLDLAKHDPELIRRIMDRRIPERETSEALSRLERTTTPETAQRAQATENQWRAMDKEFGLLTSSQVADRVGKSGRSYTHARHKAGELLKVRRGGHDYYPGFQVSETGPEPVMAKLAELAEQFNVREASVLLWMVAPATWWDGLGPDEANRPVDHMDDPEQIVAAFRSTFGDQG